MLNSIFLKDNNSQYKLNERRKQDKKEGTASNLLKRFKINRQKITMAGQTINKKGKRQALNVMPKQKLNSHMWNYSSHSFNSQPVGAAAGGTPGATAPASTGGAAATSHPSTSTGAVDRKDINMLDPILGAHGIGQGTSMSNGSKCTCSNHHYRKI